MTTLRVCTRLLLSLLGALIFSANAQAATVNLAWDPNTDNPIGYIISYGTRSGVYDVAVDVGNRTTFSVVLNEPGTRTYYFAVQAYNQVGRSAYSREVATVVTGTDTRLVIDVPIAGSVNPSDVFLSGWAADPGATAGTGVDAIHVYAYPNPGSGAPPVFLGVAVYGGSRPDVAAAMGGTRFTNSGYTLPIVGLTPGMWDLAVFAHSTVNNEFSAVRTTRISVYPPNNPPAITAGGAAIGIPTLNQVVRGMLTVNGWAVDRRSTNGAGMDVVQVWAYPSPGSGTAPLFLGNASYGIARSDIASLFGDRFRNSGFNLDLVGLEAGIYDIVVLPRSTVTGLFEVARVTRMQLDPALLVTVDRPVAGATVPTAFPVSGWALDRRATSNSGVDALHVWAYPNPGSGAPPIFLGATGGGVSRGDVAAIFGSQHGFSGFSLPVSSLAPGVYDIIVFGHSSVSGSFDNAKLFRITVQ